jgi:hypothetical protein
MELSLLSLFISNDLEPISVDNKKDMLCLENYFDLYLNSLAYQTPSFNYNEIDHELFVLYFANNSNNVKSQGEFLLSYLENMCIDRKHNFSCQLSEIIKETWTYL